MSTARSILLSMCALLLVFGCGDETTGPENTDGTEKAFPYTLPDSTTMELDLSHLSGGAKPCQDATGLCHAVSAFAVGYANAVVFAYTAIPRLAFIAALTQPATWVPPSTWVWDYTIEAREDTARIELTGTVPDTTAMDWEMRISGTRMDLDRFLWVSGQSLLDATEGHWILYDPNLPAAEQEALRVEWLNQAMYDRALSFVNVNTNHEGFGDTLSYTLTGNNAQVRFQDIDTGTTWVEWDTGTGEGRLYGAQGDSCCWGPGPHYADTGCE